MRNYLLAGATLALFASGAQAADLGAPRAAIPNAVAAPVGGFNWTGFYGGLGLGGHMSQINYRDIGIRQNLGNTGAMFGGQIGANYQMGNVVIGAEADIFASTSTRRFVGAIVPGDVYRLSAPWLASARLRAGLAADRTLFYVTGGLGVGGYSERYTLGGVTLTNRGNRTGWVLGGGVEYALMSNWSVKAEYLYYNFGQQRGFVAATDRLRYDAHTVKIGLNYLFATGGSVSARY